MKVSNREMNILKGFTKDQLERVVNNEFGIYCDRHVEAAGEELEERTILKSINLDDIKIWYQKKDFNLYHLSSESIGISFTNIKELEEELTRIVQLRASEHTHKYDFKVSVIQEGINLNIKVELKDRLTNNK